MRNLSRHRHRRLGIAPIISGSCIGPASVCAPPNPNINEGLPTVQPVIQNPNPSFSTQMIPTGSYTLSCKNISVTGDTLIALCQRKDGSFVVSYLANVSLYAPGSIYNDDGQLKGQAEVVAAVDQKTGQVVTSIPPGGPLPPGAGFQQVEDPGNPYPYVYIGSGNNTLPLPATVPITPRYTNPQYANPQANFNVAPTYTRTITAFNPGSSGPGALSTVTSFLSRYKVWLIGGAAALVIGPRLLKRVGL